MKIKILDWKDAVKASNENNDNSAGLDDMVFGIDKSWKYWGKVIDNVTPRKVDGLLVCIAGGMYVPYWLYEEIDEYCEV